MSRLGVSRLVVDGAAAFDLHRGEVRAVQALRARPACDGHVALEGQQNARMHIKGIAQHCARQY